MLVFVRVCVCELILFVPGVPILFTSRQRGDGVGVGEVRANVRAGYTHTSEQFQLFIYRFVCAKHRVYL